MADQFGILISKYLEDALVSKNDPTKLVFTTGKGVLGIRQIVTYTATTDSNGDIDTTFNHNFGYTPICIVRTNSYDHIQSPSVEVKLPVVWRTDFQDAGHDPTEVYEFFQFKVYENTFRMIVHAEKFSWDTFENSYIVGKSYTFKVIYFYNEMSDII